jgi:hypothetical protein
VEPVVTSPVELLDWISSREVLQVQAWPMTDAPGDHGLRSEYVELFWLPILGPSAVLALRRLAECISGSEPGVVPLTEFARCLGLGSGLGRRAPAVRTLARLVDFHLARVRDDRFEVRAAIPCLNPKQIGRLPAVLIALHEQSYGTGPTKAADETARLDESLLSSHSGLRQACAGSLSTPSHRSAR